MYKFIGKPKKMYDIVFINEYKENMNNCHKLDKPGKIDIESKKLYIQGIIDDKLKQASTESDIV